MNTPSHSSNRPNVIIFFTDQQRWDMSGVHGCPMDLTPCFDRMATGGTLLANAFTCQPVCGPARACLQTGQYATSIGVPTNGYPLPTDAVSLAKCFNEAGYRTGYIGKWHLGERGSLGPVEEAYRGGYQDWLAANTLEMTSDAYDCVVYDEQGKAVKLPGYRVDAMTDAAIRYIDAHQDNPFFLCLSFLEPHHQNHIDDYPPPEGYRQRYTGQWLPPDLEALGGSSAQHFGGYCGMIKRLDEALGRMLDALTSLKLDDNTIVLYVTDHGCHFKTRNAEYKRSCHDSSIRLPVALRGPGFDGGGRVRELVSLVDLPATLLDAAGLEVPSSMQGRSVLPLLKGGGREAVDWPQEIFYQISESGNGRGIRTQRWKYAVHNDTTPCDEHGHCDRYTEAFLYDLDSDPYELRNLIAIDSYRPIADELRGRLLARMKAAGEPSATLDPPGKLVPGAQRFGGSIAKYRRRNGIDLDRG